MFAFNRLVRLRNQTAAAWADVDVQLTRRHELVPQLVAAVRAYASHERATLEAVTELRSKALGARGRAELGELESALVAGVSRLVALREAYPELEASESFAQLARELVEVEDQLQYARRFYNGAVRDYDTARLRVPDLFVARGFGFASVEYFQAGEEARTAPRVAL